ncbi:hypothetical protein [Kineococcus rubinsiae]|uniref:hypothetical protein n=1 Tax=Kineococcus rubinsiae TaxID=2609562 RepID=UPI0014316EA5|nr:hypothetical protein [Kineococcus rubinsiae]NIZ89540.1 hypothetical protein [Kineococcus rubinsiae]
MDVTGTARTLVGQVASAAGRVLPGGGTATSPQQTLTFTSSPTDVLTAVRDAGVWSQVLGEFGAVELEAPGRYRFTSEHGPAAGTPTELRETGEVVQFTRTEGGGGPLVELRVTTAPPGRGTEVALRLDLPLPDLATGAATFTVLYRLRALLQTGEVPTITPQPSARPASR